MEEFEMTGEIKLSELSHIWTRLGLRDKDVVRVEAEPDGVTITYVVRDQDGHITIDDDFNILEALAYLKVQSEE